MSCVRLFTHILKSMLTIITGVDCIIPAAVLEIREPCYFTKRSVSEMIPGKGLPLFFDDMPHKIFSRCRSFLVSAVEIEWCLVNHPLGIYNHVSTIHEEQNPLQNCFWNRWSTTLGIIFIQTSLQAIMIIHRLPNTLMEHIMAHCAKRPLSTR